MKKTGDNQAVQGLEAAHWRLLTAVAVGGVTWAVALGLHAPRGSHLLIGWIGGALAYLALIWRMFLTADEAKMRARAAQEDEGLPVLLLIVLAAIVASLAAVVDAMRVARNAASFDRGVVAACAGATLVLSWLVLHSVFAPHYAHRHFGDSDGKGIEFPGEKPTGYLDFVYLSFTLGATFQVSDNAIRTSRLRRLVIGHSMTAYAYNTAILALGINIIAGVVSG